MEVECIGCNNPFDIEPNKKKARLRRGAGNLFCTPECARSWQSRELKREVVSDGVDRVCSKCHEPFSAKESLYREDHRIRGLCRKCLYKYQNKRLNRRKAQAVVYLGGSCKECGRTGHPVIFDFHHRGDKEFEWGRLRRKSWDKIVKELDKCDLLCAPCHRIHHVNPEMWDFLDVSVDDEK